MRLPHALSGLLLLAGAAPALAQQAADDRLRNQLRTTTLQLRSLTEENQRLQAEVQRLQSLPPKVDTRRADQLQRQLDDLQLDLRHYQRLVGETQGLAEQRQKAIDTESAAKRSALEQALADAGRRQQAEQALATCSAQNTALVSIARELDTRFRDRGVFDALLAREPLTGLRRAHLESLSEQYRERIDAARLPAAAAPSTTAPPAAAPSSSTTPPAP